MSQPHSHAPGQPCNHNHGPQPQQAQMVMRPPDPVMQALIEESFREVDIALGPPDNTSALCGAHRLEKCAECDVDFTGLNRLAKFLVSSPALRCPPPPQIANKNLSAAITNTKEEGNTLFKGGLHDKAIARYTMAASIAVQRPPWEAQVYMREELSTVLSNRSAAFVESGDYIGALVDAETVIQLKRPWSKGHFRKARALMKLDRYQEAKEAMQLGLSFEPNNQEMIQLLADIESALKTKHTIKYPSSSEKTAPAPLPIPVS